MVPERLCTKVEKNRETEYVFGLELMNDMTSLHLFRNYASGKRAEYGYPDIVLLLTGRDLYESTHRGPNRNVSGIADEGGLCTDHYVAIAEDIPGSYSGVLDAAHELGHSMGASHDGTPPNMQLGNHPGSLGCSPSSGHIMTYVDGGHLRYKFSECNKMEIRHLLRHRGSTCWEIKAKKSYAVKGVYPGALLTPGQYCRMLYKNKDIMYSLADERLRRYCKMRCCAAFPETKHKCALHRMLDYMPCSFNKVCFQGVCRRKRDLIPYSRRKGRRALLR
nr:A disintegrin and metalloproteinase with thrombospondin motifs like isoform X1 [Dermacentor andersoni]